MNRIGGVLGWGGWDGGKGLPTEKATVTKERVKECAFQLEKKIIQWNKLSRERFFTSNKSLMISWSIPGKIFNYKIIHLTSISKLAQVCVCVPQGVHNKGFYAHKPI